MTTFWREHRIEAARCPKCDHDLIARTDGHVVCSRRICHFHTHPLRLRSETSYKRKEKNA